MTQSAYVEDIASLEALYGTPPQAALVKVARRMTPAYRRWIMESRLCVLSTVGPEGTDGSPRGDEGPVVAELDPGTLAMPDWHGNNRLDSLRNIVRDGRVSLMFMVPGSANVMRVNGTARLSTDEALRGRFEKKGRLPTTVNCAAGTASRTAGKICSANQQAASTLGQSSIAPVSTTPLTSGA